MSNDDASDLRRRINLTENQYGVCPQLKRGGEISFRLRIIFLTPNIIQSIIGIGVGPGRLVHTQLLRGAIPRKFIEFSRHAFTIVIVHACLYIYSDTDTP